MIDYLPILLMIVLVLLFITGRFLPRVAWTKAGPWQNVPRTNAESFRKPAPANDFR